MKADAEREQCLYARVLASDWDQLPRPIREFHDHGGNLTAHGVFSITRGEGIIARLLGFVCRLPRGGKDRATVLQVWNDGHSECWLRQFAGANILSRQREMAPGLIAERFGILQLEFSVGAANQSLEYLAVSASVAIGPIRLQLPRWLSPTGQAWERVVTDQRVDVRVEISMPMAGRILMYEGWIRPIRSEK